MKNLEEKDPLVFHLKKENTTNKIYNIIIVVKSLQLEHFSMKMK